MTIPADVRLNESEVASLRQFRTVHGGSERRKHVRHLLPETFPLVVRVTPKGGHPQALSVSARDISGSGMGFYNTTYVHVGMGSLVDTPSIRPTAHIFVGSKAHWFEITDDLPQFEEYAG